MRVAVDAADLVRDRRGLGRITRDVLRAALDDPGVAVTLLAGRSRDRRALRTEFCSLPVEPARSARRDGRYDVVWYPFNAMRFAAAAPCVSSIADAFAFTEPHREFVARAREQRPIRRAAQRSRRIITLSAWSRAQIAHELEVDPGRIEVVAPTPAPFWTPGDHTDLPPALRHRRFALVVGAREPRKNVRTALAACARAFRRANESLVIVPGLQPDDLAFARDLRVRAGTVAASDATLRALYRNATVVLVPSFAEGFGLVAVEAMACGAPVIASDAAALPEATGDGALRCNPHDVDAWVAAIRAIYDDAAFASALRALALRRSAQFDRSAAGAATLEILRATAHA